MLFRAMTHRGCSQRTVTIQVLSLLHLDHHRCSSYLSPALLHQFPTCPVHFPTYRSNNSFYNGERGGFSFSTVDVRINLTNLTSFMPSCSKNIFQEEGAVIISVLFSIDVKKSIEATESSPRSQNTEALNPSNTSSTESYKELTSSEH